MVTIITGDKNIGKTTYLESWYMNDPSGVGFLSRKVFEGTCFLGYDLILLPDGECLPFIRLEEAGGEERSGVVRQGRFTFSCSVFQSVHEWVRAGIMQGGPVWMDEIGGLELSGNGFDALFREILSKGLEMRVIFREQLFHQLLAHYKITEFTRIQLG